jgi:branched-chain amino acid transport system substrate-binding protein
MGAAGVAADGAGRSEARAAKATTSEAHAAKATTGETGAAGGAAAGRNVVSAGEISRRGLLRAGASAAVIGGAAIGGGGLLAACSSSIKGASGTSTSGTSTSPIKIAFIQPVTGFLGEFATSDDWILGKIQATSQFKNGFKIGGKTYKVEITSYDTQSDQTRAGQLANQAILSDNVDLILTSSTPETVLPVSTTAEKLGTPCVAGNVPWQAWYGALGGNPTPGKSTFKPKWNTVYFLGVNDLALAFIPMWNRIQKQLGTDKTVGCAFPNDSDGDAFRTAWPVFAKAAGYTLIDPPAYTDGLTNYSSMIDLFISDKCDFFTNVPLTPDFNVMWKQSAQLGYKPKLATVAKVLLFPTDVEALGDLVINVATDAWWTPNMPWTSSLTGETCADMASQFQTATGGQWVQSLSNYSLFEVAYAALTAVNNPHDKAEVAAALFNVNISGLAGQLNWTSSKNPAPGVVDTPCVGVQWKKGTTYPYEMYVVDNTLMPNVPLTGTLEPTNT